MAPSCGKILTSPMGSFVNGLGVVGAVGGYQLNGIDDLVQQGRDLSAVMRSASGQIRGEGFTSP
jgi:hypothetical protein